MATTVRTNPVHPNTAGPLGRTVGSISSMQSNTMPHANSSKANNPFMATASPPSKLGGVLSANDKGQVARDNGQSHLFQFNGKTLSANAGAAANRRRADARFAVDLELTGHPAAQKAGLPHQDDFPLPGIADDV